jgi:hypothetical protein
MTTTNPVITNPTITNPPPSNSPDFDQIVKGNISIKKSCKSKDRYIITFSKIGKFLMYQVWDKDNVNNINNKRKVYYVPPKEWINQFNEMNESLKKIKKPLFTPTTIMETEDDGNYAFVIHKAYINSSGHVVFIVSTKEISLKNNTSKKLTQISCGKFNNARFDIDYTFNPNTYINDIPKGRKQIGEPYCWDITRFNPQLPYVQQYGQYGPYAQYGPYVQRWYYINATLPSNWVKNVDYYVDDDGTPWAFVCDADKY